MEYVFHKAIFKKPKHNATGHEHETSSEQIDQKITTLV